MRIFRRKVLFSLAPSDLWPHITRLRLSRASSDSRGSGLAVYWLGRGPMAYTDALFQLGMDLTRSSTAQKEDHGQTAHLAPDLGKDFFIERDGVRCAGSHLIVDLYGAKRLDDLKLIKETLKRCVDAAGANPLHVHLH